MYVFKIYFIGGRLYPRPCSTHEGSPSEDNFESVDETRTAEEDSVGPSGTSNSTVTLGNDEGFAEGDGDEDVQDSIVVTSATAPKSNGFLPSLLESDDSEFEDFLDDIFERGKNMLKKGSTVSKILTSASSRYLLLFILSLFFHFCSRHVSIYTFHLNLYDILILYL